MRSFVSISKPQDGKLDVSAKRICLKLTDKDLHGATEIYGSRTNPKYKLDPRKSYFWKLHFPTIKKQFKIDQNSSLSAIYLDNITVV
jgi:hypothetical protein